MKAIFSPYLNEIAPALKAVVSLLEKDFDYVSILSTDSLGFRVSASQRSQSVDHNTLTTERGNVIRVCKNGLYSEYSFNEFDPTNPEKTADAARSVLKEQLAMLEETQSSVYRTGLPEDKACTLFMEMDTTDLPEDCDLGELVRKAKALSDAGMAKKEGLIDIMLSLQSTHISKCFFTKNRDMRQSYVYSEGMMAAIAFKEGRTHLSYVPVSGQDGPQIFEALEGKLDELLKQTDDLIGSSEIVPGTYDIITTPEITGLIAHEAFGHGVEMDMFVKNRALGRSYIGKRVGSDLVTMHEGALSYRQVASYAFDDEGTPAQDTIEIKNGILLTGVCDELSALRLGVKPTGNGRRQNYEHKAYARMTNTLFEAGTSSVDDMIASVEYGYLLDGMQSGMEDPKHWGIQCIISRGYEIKDGKLTGKVVSPIVMTGYVPDLLGSISMISKDSALAGNGYCGKGYKEFVKVSDGGPYMKAKAVLG